MEEFCVPVVSNLQIYALIVSKNVFVKEPYELVFMQVEQVHKAWRNIVDSWFLGTNQSQYTNLSVYWVSKICFFKERIKHFQQLILSFFNWINTSGAHNDRRDFIPLELVKLPMLHLSLTLMTQIP